MAVNTPIRKESLRGNSSTNVHSVAIQWLHQRENIIKLMSRHNLGNFEAKNGRTSRAIKHWIIAANMGRDGSLEALKKNYAIGIVSKEDFASALRGHKAAVDATKSPQRAVAEAFTQAMQK